MICETIASFFNLMKQSDRRYIHLDGFSESKVKKSYQTFSMLLF